jgi:flagellar biogenesis protein FliO
VVVGTIWGISVLMKKFVTVRGLTSSSDNLKVLTSLSLTPTRTLYMVRLGDRILLIGAGENGLSTLAEISDPGEVSDFLREFEFKGNFDLNPFRERLKSAMDKEGDDFPVGQDLESRQQKLKGILDKLKDSDGNVP